MPSKKTKCIDCGTLVNGVRCHPCNGVFSRKNPEGMTQRAHDLRKKYGMSLDEFEIYWQACRGKCWVCGISMEQPKKQRGQGLACVSVDHDHKTGRVRGLLCSGCNKAIGMMGDNPVRLQAAARYLCVSS